MVYLLSIVQYTLAFLLIVLVLIQRANTDASGALGQDGGSNIVLEKRGGEKIIYKSTIFVAIFFTVSLALPIFLN